MLNDYIYVFCFILISGAFVVFATFLPYLVAPWTKEVRTTQTYESGEFSLGSIWVQFHISYYLFALIFVAFDVEVVFLFPAALVYKSFLGLKELFEIILFVGVLGLALFYAWKKEVFKWR